jgi:hypothetical protein
MKRYVVNLTEDEHYGQVTHARFISDQTPVLSQSSRVEDVLSNHLPGDSPVPTP